MNIDVKQLTAYPTLRYPYTHRVQVSGDATAADKVNTWLKESEISHSNPGWGVYYLGPEATNLLVLRWA